jgi:hypothetical protein
MLSLFHHSIHLLFTLSPFFPTHKLLFLLCQLNCTSLHLPIHSLILLSSSLLLSGSYGLCVAFEEAQQRVGTDPTLEGSGSERDRNRERGAEAGAGLLGWMLSILGCKYVDCALLDTAKFSGCNFFGELL